MKRTTSYKTEEFNATNVLTAFNINIGDNNFVLGYSMSEDVLSYDEEGIINHCVKNIKGLDVLPYINKVELYFDKSNTTFLFSLVKNISQDEIKRIVDIFLGKLCPPVREIREKDSIRVVFEFLAPVDKNLVKYRKR